jgi:hypothetical protein
MPFSFWRILNHFLEGAHGLRPHRVKVGAQARHSLWIEPVQAASTLALIRHQTGILQDFQVLGYGRPADGKGVGEFVYGEGAVGKTLKDGHARGISQCVESGL